MIETNQTLQKIEQLMKERNWSIYKLALESDIPYSSLNSLFHKNNQPTISTLEKICAGFHISMYEFFLDYPPYREETHKLDKNETIIIETYRSMEARDQKLLLQIAKLMIKNHSEELHSNSDSESP